MTYMREHIIDQIFSDHHGMPGTNFPCMPSLPYIWGLPVTVGENHQRRSGYLTKRFGADSDWEEGWHGVGEDGDPGQSKNISIRYCST